MDQFHHHGQSVQLATRPTSQGPDTNSTALAVQGLSAQGVLGSAAAAKASTFIAQAEDSDGGWGYEPNAKGAPGSTDPDSTALVIQSILALGQSPSAAAFDKAGANPVSALLSFQLKSGSGKGAYFYPGSSDPNLLATYQAVPAAASRQVPVRSGDHPAVVARRQGRHRLLGHIDVHRGNRPRPMGIGRRLGRSPRTRAAPAHRRSLAGTTDQGRDVPVHDRSDRRQDDDQARHRRRCLEGVAVTVRN